MSEKPKFNPHGIILTAGVGEKTARNDGGELARQIAAAIVVDEKTRALKDAIRTAQNQPEEPNEGVDPPEDTTRQQRRAEARNLRKLADESEAERKALIRIIHKKAKAADLPFQVFVQRMMDSGAENLVEMAKIIRRIK